MRRLLLKLLELLLRMLLELLLRRKHQLLGLLVLLKVWLVQRLTHWHALHLLHWLHRLHCQRIARLRRVQGHQLHLPRRGGSLLLRLPEVSRDKVHCLVAAARVDPEHDHEHKRRQQWPEHGCAHSDER
mgnify:CR=1 FL=1